MFGINFELLLIAVALPVLTAISGLIKARNAGEKLSWPIFTKTIVIGLVSAQLLSAQVADTFVLIAGTEVVTIVADNAVNALINKPKRTVA